MNSQDATTANSSTKIGTFELLAGLLVLVAILPGSIACIAFSRSLFPYDNYTMYSNLQGVDFSWPRMYGLPEGAGWSDHSEEIDISDQKYWGSQLHIGRKIAVLRRIRNGPDAESNMQTAMAFLMDLYNARQQSGTHDGPPIIRLRTYSFHWKLHPNASNLHEPYRQFILDEYPLAEE